MGFHIIIIHIIPPSILFSDDRGIKFHVKPLSSCPFQRCQWSGQATWMVGSADEPRAVSEPKKNNGAPTLFFSCYSVADSFRNPCEGHYSQNIAHHANIDPGEKSKGAIAHRNHSEEVGVFGR